MEQHMAAIAELRARVDGHDEAIEKLDTRLTRDEEIISNLREAVAKVATKDDIADLRKDIDEKFDKRLSDAHNSIPSKVAMIFGGGMFLIALVGLVVNLMSRHG